ncbi:hypothetical protein ACIPL1_29390 [Pseudomonas sp. NPDC090202]|uniref:hypothetical protein n=1 Tax=unclassified Pseudomonas TaxID=196821 RepID=UPI003823267B
MSLSYREHYVAVIGANGVGLSRCTVGGKTWLGSAGFIADRQGAATLALDTLQRLLGEHIKGRARLSVLLSSHYSRFGLIPWSEHIATPEELRAYAAACFDETYGKSAEEWTLSLSPEDAGNPRIAVGLPQALLARLRAMVKELGLSLVSVQPYLMTAFNRFQRSLGDKDFLFVVAEPGRSTLLLAREGRWSAVRSLRITDTDAALGSMIARESELHGLNGDKPVDLFIHAPARHHDAPQILGVQTLELPVGEGDAQDALHIMSRAVN